MARKAAVVSEDDTIDGVLQGLHDSLVDEFGIDGAMRLDDESSLCNIETSCSTGSIVIDAVIAGGRAQPCPIIPFGRQTEISGPPGVGKSSLCAQIAAQTQKIGGIVVVTDTEERVDVDYWTALGVDCSKIINLRAQTLEDVFTKQARCIALITEQAPDVPMLMLWDSLGATFSESLETPKKGETFMQSAEKNMGRDAKVIGNGLKVINKMVAKSKVAYVYTNHIYHKMGIAYGSDTETPGGEKAKFFATLRLRLSKGQAIKEEDEMGNTVEIGRKVYVKAEKNSMSPKLMKKEAILIGGLGFSNVHSVFEAAKTAKLIETKGAWSTWEPSDPATGEVAEAVKFSGFQGFLDKVTTHPSYQMLVDAVVAAL